MRKMIDVRRRVEAGRYIKDIVFAANDGIVTTFAVVAGTVGAALSPVVILIIGFASIIADGFSMATGNFLGTKSEKDFYKKEEMEERKEIKDAPGEELGEIRVLLSDKGYEGEKLDQMVKLISSNKDFWVEFMMHEELKLLSPEIDSPWKNGLVTFISFITAGSIPLLPYVIIGRDASFGISIAATAVALFFVGSLRAYFSERSWVWLGLEMLLIGGIAASIAYLAGSILGGLIV